jgi:hypothetical protein
MALSCLPEWNPQWTLSQQRTNIYWIVQKLFDKPAYLWYDLDIEGRIELGIGEAMYKSLKDWYYLGTKYVFSNHIK